MPLDATRLSQEHRTFLAERHRGTLTTLRADGTPHVVPVGFTFDEAAGSVRVITSRTSVKARNAAAGCRGALCSVDGARWLTFEGTARVDDAQEAVAEAVAAYTLRYRPPRPNPDRVVLRLDVERLMGRA